MYLQATFKTQANALCRKNLAYQKRNTRSNCCIILSPIFVSLLLLVIQVALDSALDKPSNRVEYHFKQTLPSCSFAGIALHQQRFNRSCMTCFAHCLQCGCLCLSCCSDTVSGTKECHNATDANPCLPGTLACLTQQLPLHASPSSCVFSNPALNASILFTRTNALQNEVHAAQRLLVMSLVP